MRKQTLLARDCPACRAYKRPQVTSLWQKIKIKKKKEPNRRASGKTERSPVSHTERGLAKTEIIRVFSKSQAVGQAAEGRAREAGGCQGGRRSWRHLARLT